MKPILSFLAFVAGLSLASSQTQLSGVINYYAQVLAIDYCVGSLKLSTIIGYEKDDMVLLIQMKGATMNESNTAAFGSIINPGNSGNFEMCEIKSISGDRVYLKNAPLNQYNPETLVQLVKVPVFDSVLITDTLKVLPWNGSTGGILALEVKGRMTLNAPIQADGAGFRGGRVNVLQSDCNFLTNANDFYYPMANWRGAPKGEGIAMSSLGKEQGRGALANGGGGGNDHNSGGGGGGNHGPGGSGGEQNVAGFGCDGNYPGLGGRALSVYPRRLFLGGGGGAGHVNNSGAGSSGANGGGIVFISAGEISSDNMKMSANGHTPQNANGDGAGGGGAGGMVYLNVPKLSGTLSIEAYGGNGGQVINSTDRCYGAGGGGSGGQIFTGIFPAAALNVQGGSAGINTIYSTLCNSAANGAMPGSNGAVSQIFPVPASSEPLQSVTLITHPASLTLCEGVNLTFEVKATGTNLSFQWQINSGTGWVNISEAAPYSGVRTASLKVAEAPMSLSNSSYRCVVKNVCSGEVISEPAMLTLLKMPNAQFSFSILKNTEVTFVNTSTGGLSYHWDFGDGTSSLSASPVHQFKTGGTFNVTLTVTGGCGQSVLTRPVIVSEPLKADFKADATLGCTPLVVRFSNQSKGTGLSSYKWEFEAGTPSVSTEENPVVQYLQPGVYDVKLTVSNGTNSDTLFLENIIRAKITPKASFVHQVAGLKVDFLNKSIGGSFYHWDFGDGSSTLETSPKHTYGKQGIFNVVLTAFNESCGSSTAQQIFVTTTAVSEGSKSMISIYPNPVSDLLIIEAANIPVGVSAQLSGVNGQKKWTGNLVEGKMLISIGHLSPGLYFLQLSTVNWRRVFKVVKL